MNKSRQGLTVRVGAISAQRFLMKPDYRKPHVVEVRLARTRKLMHAEMLRLDGRHAKVEVECMGLVRHWYRRIGKHMTIRPGLMVARMYLNADDMRKQAAEIGAHECTHAGMAWARIRKANLKDMPGEEVLCYAVGEMVSQLNWQLSIRGALTKQGE